MNSLEKPLTLYLAGISENCTWIEWIGYNEAYIIFSLS